MRGRGAPFTPIVTIIPLFVRANDTHHSKNHEKARQKKPTTAITQKGVGCYSPPEDIYRFILKHKM